VRMVVNELRGEKIDVVPFSENSAEFVANALQPAKVKEVRIDESTGTAMVIVPDYQLSLAIGKEGQNARLAARLTGWRIDIKSETQIGEEARAAAAPTAAPAPAEEAPDSVGEAPVQEAPADETPAEVPDVVADEVPAPE
jgi:N utilization substance protein A